MNVLRQFVAVLVKIALIIQEISGVTALVQDRSLHPANV